MTREIRYKWLGLFIALIAPLGVSFLFNYWGGRSGSFPKEAGMWFLFFMLFMIMKYGEKESFSGLGFLQKPARSFSRGLLILLTTCFALYMGLYFLIFKTRPPQEKWVSELANTPVWIKLMIALRAGGTEETFFRAYGISRIQ